jgi:EpsI family protein
MTKLAVALAFLLLNLYTYHYLARDAVIPERTSFAEFPLQIEEWSCPERQSVPQEVWEELGATDMLICDYRRDAALVNFYVGYHASQVREQGGGSGENSIHPPAHCLPGSGWDIIDNRTVPLDFDGLPSAHPTAKRLVVARGEARQLVYYWYQSRGRVISQDWQKIVYVGWDRATRGRTDGSLVRFTVPIIRGDEERAEQTFREFAPRVLALLDDYVPV